MKILYSFIHKRMIYQESEKVVTWPFLPIKKYTREHIYAKQRCPRVSIYNKQN